MGEREFTRFKDASSMNQLASADFTAFIKASGPEPFSSEASTILSILGGNVREPEQEMIRMPLP
jgi:hypothetical protein